MKRVEGRIFASGYWVLFAACFASAVYFLFRVPVSGTAIAVLAVAAVLMTLKDGMSYWHKAAWMLVTFSLFIAETRAIRKDREEFRAQHNSDLREQASQFQQVLTLQQTQFDQVLDRFKDVQAIVVSSDVSQRRLEIAISSNLSRTSLKFRALLLSNEIIKFAVEGELSRPPMPSPETWTPQTMGLVVAQQRKYYEQQWDGYFQRFGTQARDMREELAKHGLKDSQLDFLAQVHPGIVTDPNIIRMIGDQLGILADRLP